MAGTAAFMYYYKDNISEWWMLPVYSGLPVLASKIIQFILGNLLYVNY